VILCHLVMPGLLDGRRSCASRRSRPGRSGRL